MDLIYQIHNVGIYIDGKNDIWKKMIILKANEQLDGYEIYKDCIAIEKKFIIKDYSELENRHDCITVPECSRYFTDDIMYSEYVKVAYQIKDNEATYWTSDNTWYIPYVLEALFVQQGMCFVHGAGVCVGKKDGRLLLAFGGIGKTSFVASAVKNENVKLLGDDLIIVSNDGKLYSYPRPFCLYEYHKPLFPNFFNKHDVKFKHITNDMYFSRAVRKLKQLLHFPDDNVYSFLPVSPVRLFPAGKIQIDPIDLNSIYVLRRNEQVNVVKRGMIEVSSAKAKNFALDVILHEWDVGLKIILNQYAQRFESIQNYIDAREKILNSAFSHAESIECIEIPLNMNAVEVSKELNEIILGGLLV